jgi:glutathione S-transferase
MPLVDLVALLALVQFFTFGILVGRARGKYGVHAPAVSGHEMFDRTYRVQMNTLEQLVLFLPSLYLAAKYWSPTASAIAGAIYLVGRTLYCVTYLKDPRKRGLGFLLTAGPTMVLLFGSIGLIVGGLVRGD